MTQTLSGQCTWHHVVISTTAYLDAVGQLVILNDQFGHQLFGRLQVAHRMIRVLDRLMPLNQLQQQLILILIVQHLGPQRGNQIFCISTR